MESLHYNPNQTPNETPNPNTQFDEFDHNRAKFQRELDLGKSKEEILRGIERPVDLPVDGVYVYTHEGDPLSDACEARFIFDTDKSGIDEELYRKILLSATAKSQEDFNMRLNHPELATSRTYKEFITKYPTVIDFQPFLTDYLGTIHKNTPDEFKQNVEAMQKFEELLFGDQVPAAATLRDMQPGQPDTPEPTPTANQESGLSEGLEPAELELIKNHMETLARKTPGSGPVTEVKNKSGKSGKSGEVVGYGFN